MHNSDDSDGDKTSADIFYTNFDPIFLIIEDGYAMSDWVMDFGASLHVSSHKKRFATYVATKDFVKLEDMSYYWHWRCSTQVLEWCYPCSQKFQTCSSNTKELH